MEFAKKYREMGLSVIPLKPRDKTPLILWQEYQSRRPSVEEITKWYSDCPAANLGIVTGGLSGIVVVDLDGPAGIESGRSLGLASPVTVLTGSGRQLYYKHPGGGIKVCNSVKKVAPGVDIRGDGGYVAAPPSLHPNGKKYCWLTSPLFPGALPPLPSCFLQPSSTPSGQSFGRNQPGWIAEELVQMQNGHVSNTLVKVLGKFRAYGLTEDDTFKLLYPHALVGGKPFPGLKDKIAEIWARYPSMVAEPTLQAKTESVEDFLNDLTKVEWICEPIIAKRSIGFVAGLPETLKTWLLIDLAVEATKENGSWLGLWPTARQRVLFIDQERFKGETQRRFNAVIAAKGLHRKDLNASLFVKCGSTIKLDQDSSFQAFRTELLDLKPTLVIVDSFATFHSTPENDRMAIQNVLNRIKSLRDEVGCTFVFINHESKMVFQHVDDNKTPNAFDMLGSVGIVAAAEFCLTVRKLEPNTSIIHHTKSSLATATKSFYATITDTTDGIVIKGTL